MQTKLTSVLPPLIFDKERRTVIQRPEVAPRQLYELSSPTDRFGQVYSALAIIVEPARFSLIHAAWQQLIAGALKSTAHKTVYISTFAPEAYEVTKPIPVQLQADAQNVIATFFDANLSTAGDTEEEAYTNLRSLILDVFESLEEQPVNHLGSEPARQLAVLRSFMRPA